MTSAETRPPEDFVEPVSSNQWEPTDSVTVPQFETPQAVLDYMIAAGKRKDYSAFVNVLTDDEAERLAGMLLQSASMVSGLSQLGAEQGTTGGNDADAAALANIAAVMARHVKPEPPEGSSAVFQQLSQRMFNIAFDADTGEVPSAEAYSGMLRQSAGMLTDPRAFSAEIITAMDQLGGGSTLGGPDDADPEWKITVDGDSATAVDTRERKTPESGPIPPTVELRRIDGQWKISKLFSDDVISKFATGPQSTSTPAE